MIDAVPSRVEFGVLVRIRLMTRICAAGESMTKVAVIARQGSQLSYWSFETNNDSFLTRAAVPLFGRVR